MLLALLDTEPLRAEHTLMLMASAGYRGQIFQHVKSFIHAVLRDTFDVALISSVPADIALSHALIGIRQHPTAPLSLVMLTQASEQDMVAVLNQGADDCVLLPVDLALLLARVGALLRRHPSANPANEAQTQTTFPGYRFDIPRGVVETDGRRISLTPKESALALMLFRNIGRQLSRQYLIDGIWLRDTGAIAGSHSRSLDTHISRIRHKLHLMPARGYQLSSIYSHGYRLDRTEEDSAPSAESKIAQSGGEEGVAEASNAIQQAPAPPLRSVNELSAGECSVNQRDVGKPPSSAVVAPPTNAPTCPGF